jgi:hypothetical protein
MNSFLRGQEYLTGRLKDFQEDRETQTISAKCKGSAADVLDHFSFPSFLLFHLLLLFLLLFLKLFHEPMGI